MIVSINTAPCYIIECHKGPEPIYCRPRAKDVFVLSPPKTGTTFTQMVGYCSIYNLLKTGDESRDKDVHIQMHYTCPYSDYFADLFACLCTSLAIFGELHTCNMHCILCSNMSLHWTGVSSTLLSRESLIRRHIPSVTLLGQSSRPADTLNM